MTEPHSQSVSEAQHEAEVLARALPHMQRYDDAIVVVKYGPSVDETARMLGATRTRLFAELHAPLLRRASLAAMLLVFVDVMKELPATLVLRPFNSDTLAVVAYQLARDERLGEAALPSLAIVAVGLLPVLLLSRSLRPDPGH